MKYEIRLKKSAQKELKRLDRDTAERLLVQIYKLSDDPRPSASTPLVGRLGFRLRVRDYRIVYTIDGTMLVIVVIRIEHRRGVYR